MQKDSTYKKVGKQRLYIKTIDILLVLYYNIQYCLFKKLIRYVLASEPVTVDLHKIVM